MAHVTYQGSQAIYDSIRSLIDGRANGGLAGAETHMFEYTEQYADSMGVGLASIDALTSVTCAGTIHMSQGPIVLIMNQYTFYGTGSTVYSIVQLSLWS